MQTSTRPLRPTRSSRRPRQPLIFDRLEGRLVLSSNVSLSLDLPTLLSLDSSNHSLSAQFASPATDSLTPVAASPGDGSIAKVAPTGGLTVTFDRPIDPGTVGNDLRLKVEQPDGSWTLLNGDGLPQNLLQLDDTGTKLTADFGALGNGRYQLFLSADSFLAGLDGTSLASSGTDQPLSTFTIDASAVGLSDAADLGTVGSNLQSFPGSLDFSANHSAVQLEKFVLAPGHFWQVGLEVSSAREGSPLLAGLSLFDSQGHLIATSTTGRPDAPSDPYLFKGLASGTYYVGISSASNLPGQTGGYDPASASPGVPTPDASGGSFHLNLVADPADAPTSVSTLFPTYADPKSPNPTGFVVQFSGPIDPRSIGTNPASAATLIDKAGKAWSVKPMSYNESNSSLAFLFDQALPAGRYTVVAAAGGLTDLAGLRPTGHGQPLGTLGSLTIKPAVSLSNQADFGAILPKDAVAGVQRIINVSPSQLTESRVLITVPGIYALESSYLAGRPTIEINRPDGSSTVLDPGGLVGSATTRLQLNPGVYTIHYVASPGRGSIVQMSIRLVGSQGDSLLDNGVGQGSALGLRLITPSTLTPDAAPSFGGSSDSSGGGGSSGGSLISPAATTPHADTPSAAHDAGGSGGGGGGTPFGSTSANAGGGSLYFAVATAAPVGHPSANSEAVGVVGPSSSSGGPALATNVSGLPQGFTLSRGERSGKSKLEEVPEGPDSASTTADTSGHLSSLSLNMERSIDALVTDSRADGAALSEVLDLKPIMVSLGGVGWMNRSMPDGLAAQPAAGLEDVAAGGLENATDPLALEEAAQVQSADVSASVGVGLLAVAAAHFQRKIGHWVGRFKNRRGTLTQVYAGTSPVGGPNRSRKD